MATLEISLKVVEQIVDELKYYKKKYFSLN